MKLEWTRLIVVASHKTLIQVMKNHIFQHFHKLVIREYVHEVNPEYLKRVLPKTVTKLSAYNGSNVSSKFVRTKDQTFKAQV